MPRKYLSRKFWSRLLEQAPWPAEIETLLEHHLDICAGCRGQLERLRRRRSRLAERGEKGGAEEAWGRLQTRVDPARAQAIAQRDLASLLALSGPRRRARIQRGLSRFKSLPLIELLIRKSRETVVADPFEALDLAECAHGVAMRLEHTEIGRSQAMTALARTNAWRANALRATGDFKQAELLLTFALECFEQEGTGDLQVEAELRTLMASLRCDQRRFVAAEAHLNHSIELYRELEDWDLLSRTLVQKGLLLSDAGDVGRAITVTTEALDLIDSKQHPKLYLAGQHNLTDLLAEAGEFQAARERFRANTLLYDQFSDSWTQLRRRWLAGRIACGLGDLAEAEGIFNEVREGFLAENLGFFAALAGLDLALVYVEQNRSEKVRELAEEMVPIFLAQNIRREAEAALLLFQKAVQKEAVSARTITELATCMRRLRRCPRRPVY